MIVLVTNKSIMRLKLPNNAFLNFNLMKNAAFRRLSHYQEFQPHEKCQNIRSHEILNFDLMKFDLLTLSLFPNYMYINKQFLFHKAFILFQLSEEEKE